jgi:hypothetical protein
VQSSALENAVNRERIRRKQPSEHRLAIIGIRTAATKQEVNANEVRKGTLFDDRRYVVRRGTEPSQLIAKAAGLEALIPNGDAASLQAEQIQEWIAVPRLRKRLSSVDVLFR